MTAVPRLASIAAGATGRGVAVMRTESDRQDVDSRSDRGRKSKLMPTARSTEKKRRAHALAWTRARLCKRFTVAVGIDL
eukprot:scaffold72087_cov55-Phaeocystis_antarctica.AAC.2